MKTSPQSRTALFVIAGLIVVAVSVMIQLQLSVEEFRPVRSVSQAAAARPEAVSHAALVVIDVRNDFWIPEVASSAPAFQDRLRELVADCRRHGLPVIHVRTRYDENLSNWPQRFLSTHREAQLCLEGLTGEHPLSCARELEHEEIFIKGNFDAFSNEQFAGYLQESGIQKLYLCGLYTDVCILQMSAFFPLGCPHSIGASTSLLSPIAARAQEPLTNSSLNDIPILCFQNRNRSPSGRVCAKEVSTAIRIRRCHRCGQTHATDSRTFSPAA